MASFSFSSLCLPTQAADKRYTQPYWTLTDLADICLLLLKQRLTNQGIAFKPTATHKRCEVLPPRAERGVTSHEDCPIGELQRFLHQRILASGSGKELPSDHTRLVRLLEKMDSEAKFEKFLNLPPELRKMAFEFHLKELGVLRATKRPRERSASPVLVRRVVEPPICQVSRQMREDIMPLLSCQGRLRNDGNDGKS